jgi:hypothetical protein
MKAGWLPTTGEHEGGVVTRFGVVGDRALQSGFVAVVYRRLSDRRGRHDLTVGVPHDEGQLQGAARGHVQGGATTRCIHRLSDEVVVELAGPEGGGEVVSDGSKGHDHGGSCPSILGWPGDVK